MFLNDYLRYLNVLIKEKETGGSYMNDFTTYNDIFYLMTALAKLFPTEISSNELSAVRMGMIQYGGALQAQNRFFKCCFLNSQSSQKEIIETISVMCNVYRYHTDLMDNVLFFSVFVHCKERVWVVI